MENKLLDKNIKHSTKWALLGQIVAKIASPIINMILARILMPEEFGIVATITIVISFSFIFVDGGFSNYIIQHKFDNEEDFKTSLTTSFWSNLIMSLLFAGLIVALSNPLCNFLGTPGYETALMLACIEIPLNALSSIFIAYMNKQFRFKQSSIILMITSFLPFIITIPLAALGLSYYSIIIGTIASYLLKFVLYLIFSGWKPSFSFSFKALKKMFMFCFILTLRQLFIYTASYMSTFVISQSFGQHYLGLYKNSSSTITALYSIFIAATMPVLLSGLSKAESDDVYYDVYYKNQRYLAYLIIPMCIGIIIFKEEVTLIMFGYDWLEAAPLIGALACYQGINAITNNFLSTALISKGKVYTSIIYQLIETIIGGLTYYSFTYLGEDLYFCASYVMCIVNITLYIIFFVLIFKQNVFNLLKNYIKPISLTIIMTIFTLPTSFLFDTEYAFITIVLFSITIYFVSFKNMYAKDFKEFIHTYIYMVNSKLKNNTTYQKSTAD